MRRRRATGAAVLVVLGALAPASCTQQHDAAAPAAQQVELTMTDNAFTPARVALDAGLVRLTFHNRGAATHEAVVGDDAGQDDHAAAMSAEGAARSHHGHRMDDMVAVTVAPGATSTVTVRLVEGRTQVVCHRRGHRESGMVAVLDVGPRP